MTGCMGDRSVAMICESGNSSAISIGQSPMPVARSRIYRRGASAETGAKKSFPPMSLCMAKCWIASLSCSNSSLGKA